MPDFREKIMFESKYWKQLEKIPASSLWMEITAYHQDCGFLRSCLSDGGGDKTRCPASQFWTSVAQFKGLPATRWVVLRTQGHFPEGCFRLTTHEFPGKQPTGGCTHLFLRKSPDLPREAWARPTGCQILGNPEPLMYKDFFNNHLDHQYKFKVGKLLFIS